MRQPKCKALGDCRACITTGHSGTVVKGVPGSSGVPGSRVTGPGESADTCAYVRVQHKPRR